ncbi:MAG TPA: ANTAR domain-containing protein [Microbacteriaceae bacterium]|nr:ANTAR domain-containing protein [Microbacteriaceae bacterium]
MDGDGTPTTDVDVRVAQLQRALSSRIVVEQAKGMLAERYSLTTDEAFELIRLAARSNGIKVQALSHSIIESPRQTPALILDIFTTLPRNSIAPVRAVENVFRQINELFLKLDNPRFICECSDTSCTDPIAVSAETVRHLHKNRDLYVVKPAHVNTDLEALVERHDGFAIVRKPAPS